MGNPGIPIPQLSEETLKGDALKFAEDMIKDDPHLTWNKLWAFIADRYANITSQKEVSDRLHTLRYADLETIDEDTATTLERITAYIDKHTTIALQSDQSGAAKAIFLSNATRGQTFSLHAKGRISASATYERTAQALETSKRDVDKHEQGRTLHRRNKRGPNHRNLLFKTSYRRGGIAETDEEGEQDVYLQDQCLD